MGFTVDSDDNVATIFFDGSPIGTILYMRSDSSGAEFVVNGLRVADSGGDAGFLAPLAYLSSIAAGGALDMPKEEWLSLGGYDDIFTASRKTAGWWATDNGGVWGDGPADIVDAVLRSKFGEPNWDAPLGEMIHPGVFEDYWGDPDVQGALRDGVRNEFTDAYGRPPTEQELRDGLAFSLGLGAGGIAAFGRRKRSLDLDDAYPVQVGDDEYACPRCGSQSLEQDDDMPSMMGGYDDPGGWRCLDCGLDVSFNPLTGEPTVAGTKRHAEAKDDDDDVCDTPRCDNRLDDGEGYDGYCGECADKKEEEGYWASRHAADTWNNRDVEKYLRSAGWELAPGDPIFPDVAGNCYVLGDREIWVSAVQTGFRIDGVDGPFVSPFDSSTGPAFSWDEVTEAISGVTASRQAEIEDVEVTCEEQAGQMSNPTTYGTVCGEPFYAYDYDGTALCRGHYDAAAQRREMGWAGGPYGDYQQ